MNSVFPESTYKRHSTAASLELQALPCIFSCGSALLHWLEQVILSIYFHANSIAFHRHGNYVCYRLQPLAASLPGKLEFGLMTMKNVLGGKYK